MLQTEQIKQLFDTYRDEHAFSGVALIRQGDEDLFTYTAGYAHRGYQIPNTLETRFDTASITKLFTAVSVLQLVDQKLLSLDDRVLDLIDIGESKIPATVTIYHLLTHTSGIADDADEEAGESYEDIFKDKPNYAVRELVDFLPNFIYKEPNFLPGEGCRYNNCAYVLLGLVIEKLSDMNYRDYIRKNIFEALNMNSSDFLAMDGIHDKLAEGYGAIFDPKDESKILGYKKNIYSYPPMGGTDGGAHTTAPDLARFMKAVVSGQLLSPQLTEEISTPKALYVDRDIRSFHKGYGFEFTKRKSDGKVFCMKKEGSNVGVACDMKYYPEIDTTVVILSNTDACNIWELAFKLSQNLGIKLE